MARRSHVVWFLLPSLTLSPTILCLLHCAFPLPVFLTLRDTQLVPVLKPLYLFFSLPGNLSSTFPIIRVSVHLTEACLDPN